MNNPLILSHELYALWKSFQPAEACIANECEWINQTHCLNKLKLKSSKNKSAKPNRNERADVTN